MQEETSLHHNLSPLLGRKRAGHHDEVDDDDDHDKDYDGNDFLLFLRGQVNSWE